MAYVKLLQAMGGTGGRLHIAGEILKLPVQHPIITASLGIVMDDDEERFECPDCGRMFVKEDLLDVHTSKNFGGCVPLKAAEKPAEEEPTVKSLDRLVCVGCGKEFTPRHHQQKYCNKECRDRTRAKPAAPATV